MPIKRGRNPCKSKPKPALGLREIQNGGDEATQEIDRFEEMLQRDPGSLTVWIKYIKWMQDQFPNGSKKLLPLFERCTREFSKNESYRNDERYIKIWIGYADMLPNPSEVFKYMRTEGIGDQLALYYVATAWTAERRKDFSLADKAYKVGLEKKAKPVEMLRKRHREFQRRMSRYLLNQVEQQETKAEVVLDENNQPLKATRGNRRLNSQGNLGVSAARKPPQQVQNEKFDIFVEKDAGFKENDWAHNGVGRLSRGQEISTKENTRKPTPWVNQGLAEHVVASRKPEPPRSFGVFVDEESKTEQTMEASRKESAGSGGLRERATKGKSKPKLTEAEQLRKHPLRNFDRPDAVSQAKPKRAVREPTPKQSVVKEESEIHELDRADDQDLTINTKLAFEDMFEMFASPSMKDKDTKALNVSEVKPTQQNSSIKKPSRKPFAVFEAGKSPASSQKKPAKPFAVFSKEETVSTKPQIEMKRATGMAGKFQIHEDSADMSRSAPSSRVQPSKAPFAIHTDADPNTTASSPARIESKKKLPFAIHTDTTVENTSPENQTLAAEAIFSHKDPKSDGLYVLHEEEVGSQNTSISSSAAKSVLVDEAQPSENQENENLPKLGSLGAKVDASRALKLLESRDESIPEGFDEAPESCMEDILVFPDGRVSEKSGLSKGFEAFEDDDDLGLLPAL